MHYLATREELVQSAERLFDVVGRGAVRVSIGQTYPLRDAARAHADLEGAANDGIDRPPALNGRRDFVRTGGS